MPRTTVFGHYDHNVVGAIERVADHVPEPPAHTPRQRYWTIRAKSVVLATGANERLIAFPGNDIPGVMLAGAAQTYAARFGVLAGGRALLFTNNDAAYDSVFALQDAGMAIAGIVDPRPDSATAAAARARGITMWSDSEIIGAVGGRMLRGARIRRRGGAGTETTVVADLLAISGGINPAVHLASQAQTPLVWDERLAAWVPGVPVLRQHSAGAAAGRTGIEVAAADGARAGAAAAVDAGFAGAGEIPLPEGSSADATVLPLWEVKAAGKSFVDLQDDVTASDIRLAHREGYRHIEHAKRYTTHTMGTDQGKTGGLVGAAVLAEARGETVQQVGMSTFRPFVTPVALGAVAGPHVGRDFAPIPLYAAARVERAARRRVHGCRDLAAPRLLPRARRCRRVGERAARGARGAARRRHLRRVHVGKNRRAGARRGDFPRPALHQHFFQPAGGPRALRPDAARGWHRVRRRHHQPPGRGPVLRDHHHRQCRTRAGAYGISFADLLAGPGRAACLGDRPVRVDVDRRSENAGNAIAVRAWPGPFQRGVSVHGGRRCRGGRLPGAAVPHQLFRRDGVRNRDARGLRREGLGSSDAGG